MAVPPNDAGRAGASHTPNLDRSDPEIADIIRREARRQALSIELIASENFVSEAVLEAAGTVLTNKYAEGYPAAATTVAARSSTRRSASPSSARSSSSASTTRTCSRTPARRRMPRCTSRCSTSATRSSP